MLNVMKIHTSINKGLQIVSLTTICLLASCRSIINYDLVLDPNPQSNLPIRYASADSAGVVCRNCKFLKFLDRPVRELYLVGKKCVIDDSVSPNIVNGLERLVSFPGELYIKTSLDSLSTLREFTAHYPYFLEIPGFLSKNKHLEHLLMRLADESALTIDLSSFDSLRYFAVEFDRLHNIPDQILALQAVENLRVWVRNSDIDSPISEEISRLSTLRRLEIDIDACKNIDALALIPNLEYLLVSSFSDPELLYKERAKLQHLKGFDIVGLTNEDYDRLSKFLPMMKRKDWPRVINYE